ncbi:MAG TPA: zinc-dependent metalloprotease family protein [Flavobacterium sp.]|nr:zinc-dependent metalloprotease family protein [Flavobacterium sp.]
MKKTLLLSILTIFLFANSYAQNPLWKQTSTEKLSASPKTDRSSVPQEYKVYTLDLPALKSQLLQAPSRESNEPSTVIVQLPTPDGMQSFRVYEASAMHPDLAAQHPEIQGYLGVGIENPSSSVRISTTIFGLHAMFFTNKGISYIDPYTTDLKNYIVYEKGQLPIPEHPHFCQVTEELSASEVARLSSLRLASDGQYRTYRLAMACTAQYAAYHITAAGVGAGTVAQKKAAVLAAMNVSMVRINGIYERDMSLKMQLIANENAIIFVDAATQPFLGNDDAPTLIDESQTVIDANIGAANYDIGHTVSTGGGGLAQSPSVCISGKARGITGSDAPVGDAYDIDFVAHEMGHQFGASHTFNGVTLPAGGNCTTSTRSNSFAVEPGSGTTIMAYAGICGIQDVQAHSDDHFHAVSIAQMVNHVTGSGACSVNVANGNTAPVVSAGADYTIPYGTAFILKGTGSDANGDSLTYCWEQTDNQTTGVTQPPVPTNTGGPNFRSFTPSTSPNRYMPSFSEVLAGNLIPKWEVIPNVARTMNFALTARDNRTPNGGQTNRDNMLVTVAAVGPFKVTSPSVDNVSWTLGSTQTVTWDVAGTTANGINTANVNILLSTDGGVTFGTVLSANTPNDGSQSITVPSTAAPYCRIMIEAVGNIYYALSKSIAIGYTIANTCTTYTNNTPLIIPDGVGNNMPGALMTSTINVPTSGVITDVNVTVNATHAFMWDLQVKLKHPDNTSNILLYRQCNQASGAYAVTLNDGSPGIVCGATGSAVSGTYSPLEPLSVYNGKLSGGNWQLTAQDTWIVDSGSITSWSVIICSLTATLATENFELADFAVYPNPNNGNFNIKFTGSSSNGVKVLVHDMRGRTVFENDYANSATFDQNISLNNAQTGVYILTVTDGERKAVKKIVIE